MTHREAEPAAIRRRIGCICFPILDGAAPTPGPLREAIAQLRPGTILIHFAQGHG
jgi:hypothetical protein